MAEFWETAFTKMQMAWGLEPTISASLAGDYFARAGAKDVLIPGIGYGRNAKPFLERGMSVMGIEISETAIALARSRLGLEIPIVHGSVTGKASKQPTKQDRPSIGRSYPSSCLAGGRTGPPFKPCMRISRTRLTDGLLLRCITQPPGT